MKSPIASKTLWTAGAAILAGAVDQVQPFIPPDYHGVAMAALGLVFAVLRFKTGQPLQ